jgi:tight adherence protein C
MTHFFMSQLLPVLSGAAIVLPAALALRKVALTQPLDLPLGGTRGYRRRQALTSPLFCTFDPALRRAGALVKAVLQSAGHWELTKTPSRRLEAFERKLLIGAGEPWGLDRHEALALSVLCAMIGAFFGAFGGRATNTTAWILPGAVVGAGLVQFRLQALRAERFSEMSRELPATIDLISLAMNAGADFPGAIRRVIKGQKGVVTEELEHLLRSLDLGITRQGALLALQERMPVEEVRDLVRAILLAEKKGSSVREALAQQASSSRQRRSVRAEEAAARAGLLLLLPLMLLMGCIMILLVGPLMVSGVSL